MSFVRSFVLGCVAWSVGCNQVPPPPKVQQVSRDLEISEVMANNEGSWIDEWGEADDFIELTNRSKRSIALSKYSLVDDEERATRLPDLRVAPGEAVLLWADSDPEQGSRHLPFKVSSSGELLRLIGPEGVLEDEVELPVLGVNEAYGRFRADGDAFVRCRYPSPAKPNPERCEPPAPPSLADVEFEPFALPRPYPHTTSTLVISELALRPAEFVEILNAGDKAVRLGDYELWLAPTKPGLDWPAMGTGVDLELPKTRLSPGERVAVRISDAQTEELAQDPLFEGVVTLFRKADGSAKNRVDFMNWPKGSSLSRSPDASGPFSFCTNTTEGEDNDCEPLQEREVGDRDRYLRTPSDFGKLTKGDPLVGIESLKFVVDLDAGGAVHLLGSERWPLHYNFVRELIYHQPKLDRCDPAQNSVFYQGWYDFSVTEYFQSEGRRFLLGTLSLHGSTKLHAVEYTFGDAISGEQMKGGFYRVIPHTMNAADWVLRVQDDNQVEKVRDVEGTLPVVGPNAPFVGMTYQPLTRGVAFGTLRFIPAAELDRATFGRDTIVVTDDVPNDIPFVAGLVTEAFQTPLAHVNVLSQNRNTPNAALLDARNDPRLRDHFDQLVRLEVTATDLVVREATSAEVKEYLDARETSGPVLAPRLDTSVRGVQPLVDHDISSIPIIGAKASQMAELGRINVFHAGCPAVPFRTPEDPFAIPVVHYLEHFESSGARARLAKLRRDPTFEADPALRAAGLEQVRNLILTTPVDPELLSEVSAAVAERFGNERVRFRSSSNTEDLPTFNGAGLYTSVSAELGDPDRKIEDAIRIVWASLWNDRAYDERRYANIDDEKIAMGVLVHPAQLSEEANGVAVSRNILDPNRGDIYYINVQAGEASVTNPAPGVTTDQLTYSWNYEPHITYTSGSSVLGALKDPGPHVLTDDEVRALACALGAVHDWFRPKLDPLFQNRWFAMETEFKFLDGDRTLLLKQARPHSFGATAFSSDCRDF